MKKFNFSKGLIVGLLTFALSIVAFAAVGASADEAAATTPTKSAGVVATYVAATDTVESTANATAYVYVVKAASGNKIKAGTSAAGQLAAGKIKISDLGIKGTKKDVFLYVCDKEVEVDETVAANLTIKGNANKVVGVIDYTQADKPGSADVLSAYYVDKSTKKQVAIASGKLYWSADQETWYLANSLTQSTRKDSKGQATADGFLGTDLAGMLEAGGVIYVKQAGTDGGATAQFGSAVAKVKVAKQAKAPKVKIDVAKDTIALKNGFDFSLAVKTKATGDDYRIVNWYTILPVLKTATVATDAQSIVGGEIGNPAKLTAYKPLGKKDANAGKVVSVDATNASPAYDSYSYTKVAYKTLSINKLFEVIGTISPTYAFDGLDGDPTLVDFQIAVRKSATEKKPASAYTLIDIDFKTEAPIVWTEANVKGQFLVASADEFSKKGLKLGEIAPFAGYTGNKVIATTGFDASFKIAEATNATKDRDEGSVFEYAVVSTADYFATGDAAIDWTTLKWKKFDPAKLKITEKLSGKYSTVKGTKKTADLKGTATAEIKSTAEVAVTKNDSYGRTVIKDDAVKTGTKSLLLVRRQGDKSTGKRASEEVVLYVAKEGKKYNLYSTVSNGEVAYKYTVGFFTYDSEKKGFYRDDSIAEITGWSQKTKTGVKLEDLTDAAYYKIASVVSNEEAQNYGEATLDTTQAGKYAKAENAIAATTGQNSTDAVAVGEYQVDISAVSDSHVDIAIREFANAKVKVVFGKVTANDWSDFKAIGEGVVVAEIQGGKDAAFANNAFAPAQDAAVGYYIGTAFTNLPLKREIEDLIPDKYTTLNINGASVKIKATGEGYSDALYGDAVSATLHKQDAEIEIMVSVVDQYTITIDPGKGSIKDGKASSVKTVSSKTLGQNFPDGAQWFNMPSESAGENKHWEFDKFTLDAKGEGTVVTSSTSFSADATIYAQYKAVDD